MDTSSLPEVCSLEELRAWVASKARSPVDEEAWVSSCLQCSVDPYQPGFLVPRPMAAEVGAAYLLLMPAVEPPWVRSTPLVSCQLRGGGSSCCGTMGTQSMCLMEDGSVWAWGSNGDGEPGCDMDVDVDVC